ncbi:MAG: DUF2339 domain-containing protein [Hyphomicrobiales bacterium]|nr:MAG: DUF2339 domain-containing protein [Hyphomicrobiales bacterium]
MGELLAIIALVVTVFVLGGRISGLERRLTKLNESFGARLQRLESGPDRGAEVLSELRGEAAPETAKAPPVPAASMMPSPEEAPSEAGAAAAADEDKPPATDGPWTPVPPQVTAPKRFDWERFIGLRLPVWLGAIALSVAGFFFVSYAIESGFFGPEMRVLSAAAASLAFLAGAEFVRRRVKGGNVAAIASALGAAAIATAYATAYLATKTYGLVPSGAGFIATVAVSLAAIAIALAYGQVVALVGIVGGYVAPLVYGGDDANAAFLALYVVALTAVSFAVIRFRGWWRLSIVGLAGPALWFVAWAFSWQLARETVWGSVMIIALPVIAAIASWPGWREDSDGVSLRGITGFATAERRALSAAVILAAIGFIVCLGATDFNIGYWQGLVVFAALAVGLGYVSPPHRALQLPILIAASVALLLWDTADQTSAFLVTGLFAIVLGYGALDQFRRLREPGLWAGVFAFTIVFMFVIALFKITGWQGALDNKHLWAASALLLATGFVVLLRVFAPRLADETQRSQVYAAWGGAVTTLVSLAVVLELYPLYFPAAAAIAILGLGAVHMRAPVRGLRILAALYLLVYAILILGAFSYLDPGVRVPGHFTYLFARDITQHALVLLVLPGLAMLAGATLFQLSRPKESRLLVTLLDIAGMIIEVIGLFYLLAWSHISWSWDGTLLVAARIAGPELLLAAAAIYLGRRFHRPAAYVGGIILTGLMGLAMLGTQLLPLLQFWPPFEVPGTIVFNITLLAYGLPAALLYFIGWHLRKDERPGLHYFGIGVSLFAVLVTYAMLMVDIRQAWHLGAPTIEGDISQSEFYAYSIGTLAFGLLLLIGGVVFKHRGARATSFVFVLAATVKVFLFDASELEGLWRVLSFLLMGLSFLGISWAYARFVFGIGLPKDVQRPPDTPVA